MEFEAALDRLRRACADAGSDALVVLRRGLVAVRRRREGTGPDPDPKREARLVMPGFVDLVRALAPEPGEDSPWDADGPWWLRGLLFLRRLRA